jgi:hypothetical protein
MFCPHCGRENPDDARFCGACGQSITAHSASASTGSARRPARAVPLSETSRAGAEAGRVSNGLKYGILVGSLLIPILGVGMGLVYWLRPGDEERKALGRLWFFVGLALTVFYAMAGGNF